MAMGRGVTSLEHELGADCPSMDDVKHRVTESLMARLMARVS